VQTFLQQYLAVSMRAIAYVSGALLLTPVNALADIAISSSVVRWAVFFVLNIVEFEVAGAIIARTYHPHFPPGLEPGSHDYETRLRLERYIYQLALFFGFDLILVLAVVLAGFNPEALQYWIWGIGGFMIALSHFGGVAMVATSFYDANNSQGQPILRTLRIMGVFLLLPGYAYVGIASWVLLRPFF
jgi:hypothetical protein